MIRLRAIGSPARRRSSSLPSFLHCRIWLPAALRLTATHHGKSVSRSLRRRINRSNPSSAPNLRLMASTSEIQRMPFTPKCHTLTCRPRLMRNLQLPALVQLFSRALMLRRKSCLPLRLLPALRRRREMPAAAAFAEGKAAASDYLRLHLRLCLIRW